MSPLNWAYLVKNGGLNYGFLILTYTVMQFRESALYYAAVLFVGFEAATILGSLAAGRLPLTLDWQEFLLGDRVILFQAVVLGPGLPLFLTAMLAQLITRAIRGFTALAERWSPEELVAFLEEFRKRLTREIFAHLGTIDKFIGDGIMAVFGLPQALRGKEMQVTLYAVSVSEAASSTASLVPS